MGLFERYLSVWVALCIAAGVILGNIFPGLFSAIARLEYAHVNLVVAVFIWVMIYPMMVQIDFHAVKDIGRRPRPGPRPGGLLADQALHHGRPGLAVFPGAVRRLGRSGHGVGIYRRHDSARCGSVHRRKPGSVIGLLATVVLLFGYMVLGVLISTLAGKVARRS